MIIIPAQLESFRTLKDRTLKVSFETNELTPNEVAELSSNIQQFGYLAFKVEPVELISVINSEEPVNG
jgi:hypothetical protein